MPPTLPSQKIRPTFFSSPRSIRSVYIILAALSGACGTGYEVLYNRALTSILGHTFSVNAAILVSFLLGIALGSLLAHRFLAYLWLVEVGLGLYTISFFGLLSASGSYGGQSFLYFFSHSHSLALIGGCVLTLIPALLVGMSVPMFSRYLKEHFSWHPFRVVYLVYNLGAFSGVLLLEFLLLRIMPVSGTAYFMGGVNLLVGFSIFMMRQHASSLTELKIRWRNVFPPLLLLSLFVLSVSSSVFQLFFLKTVYYTTGRFNSNFALSLATIFLYLAAGAWMIQVRPSFSRWVFPAAILSTAFWFAAQPMMLTMVAIFNSIAIKLSLPTHTGWILSVVWLGFPLLFYGASVPACMRSRDSVSRDSGILLLVSGLGNVTGYLLFTLALHPNLKISFVLAIGALLAMGSLPGISEISNRVKVYTCSITLLLLSTGLFTWNPALYFLSLEEYESYSILKKQSRLTLKVEEFPSHDQTFALRHYYSPKYDEARKKYFIDGYVSLDLPSEESIAGSAAAIYADGRDNLLVLGFGTGMSAGAASVFFKEVDLVELNPEVVRLQDRFADINFNIHRLPKTQVFQGDGFQYLIRNDKKYDMIISTVTAPFYPASGKMYTEEFYGLVAKRLRPGGIFSNWFDIRLHPKAVSIFMKTLNKHFSYCALNYIYNDYYVTACSDRPLKPKLELLEHGDISLAEYEDKVEEGIQKRLKNRALIPNVLEPRNLRALGVKEETPVNRLDWPVLEYFHPEKARDQHLVFMKRLLPIIDFGYSFADGRPMTKEEFRERCRDIEDWFEDGEPECSRQYRERQEKIEHRTPNTSER